MRTHRVQHAEGGVGVTIIIGGLSDDGKVENATALGRRILRWGFGPEHTGGETSQNEREQGPAHEHVLPWSPRAGHEYLSASIHFLPSAYLAALQRKCPSQCANGPGNGLAMAGVMAEPTDH